MTQIVIDKRTAEQLQAAKEEVVVVSEDGRVLGTFDPMLQPPYPPELIPPMSEEELRESLSDPRRYTTEEVLRHLDSL